jgi:hypothetical protein
MAKLDTVQNALDVVKAAIGEPLKPKAFKMPRTKLKRMIKKASQQMGRKRKKSVPKAARRKGSYRKTHRR